MIDSERINETRATTRTVSGILCTMFAAGLLMWAVCWVLWVTSNGGIGALLSGPFVIVSTVAQIGVAATFAAAAILYFRDSPRARKLLWISSIVLLLQMPLALLAIYELTSAGS